jgi:hypothetical protein
MIDLTYKTRVKPLESPQLGRKIVLMEGKQSVFSRIFSTQISYSLQKAIKNHNDSNSLFEIQSNDSFL